LSKVCSPLSIILINYDDYFIKFAVTQRTYIKGENRVFSSAFFSFNILESDHLQRCILVFWRAIIFRDILVFWRAIVYRDILGFWRAIVFRDKLVFWRAIVYRDILGFWRAIVFRDILVFWRAIVYRDILVFWRAIVYLLFLSLHVKVI